MKNIATFLLGFLPFTMACLVLGNTPKISFTESPSQEKISTSIVPTKNGPLPEYPGLIVFQNIKMEYYDIQGSTADDLLNEMYDKGPIAGFENYQSVAAVEYDLWYTWPGKSLGDCDLNKAEIGYYLKVIAPRWSPPPNVSAELIESWINYMKKVQAHEEEHIKILRKYHAILDETIASSTCLAASDAANKVEQNLIREEAKLDQETEPIIFP
jgi:predicted secreted Zn-dependent protease